MNRKLMRATFSIKIKSSPSLGSMEYFTFEASKEEAQEKAQSHFNRDISETADRLNSVVEDLTRYFKSCVLTEVDVIE